MRFICLSSLLLLFHLSSIGQDDRGCGWNHKFSVTHGLGANGHDLIQASYSGMDASYFEDSNEDTIYITLLDTGMVNLIWAFYDELMWYNLGLNVAWFRNDTLLDTTDYSSFSEIVGGACGDKRIAGSTLSSRRTGAYDLRLIGGQTNNLPIIVIQEEQEQNTEIEAQPALALSMFPNPLIDALTIQHGTIAEGAVHIYNLQGKLVQMFKLENELGATRIDLSHLSSGSYIVNIIAEQKLLIREKIIKL